MREDWIDVEIGEVTNIYNGNSINAQIKEKKYKNLKDGYNYIGTKDVGFDAVVDYGNGVKIPFEDKSFKIAPKGCVLVCSEGGSAGRKTAYIEQDICFGNKLYAITDEYNVLEGKYVFYYSRYRKFFDDFKNQMNGIIGGVSTNKFAEISIPLAPLPIQRAIVSKAEELFSDLDNGIANFKKAQEQLNIYRQAVLKKAFEGELTKEWRALRQAQGPQLPTAEELLKQIKEERQNHYNEQLEEWKKAVKEWEKNGKKASKPSKPTQPKELPPLKKEELEELPKEWIWIQIGNFMQSMCLGKMLDKAKNQGEYKPYLGNINVRWGVFNLDNLKEMRFLNSEIERFSLVKEDLVICEGGEPGRCAIWKSNEIIMIQKALHRIRFHHSITSSNYIFYFFKYSASTGYLEKSFTGTTIKHLTGESLEKFAIPLCSIQEQNQIVQEIEFRLSVCDKMEQNINESLEKAEALRQSILKKAFEGKLLREAEIEQCKKEADYEPASELLKKIQAEKVKSRLIASPQKATTKNKTQK